MATHSATKGPAFEIRFCDDNVTFSLRTVLSLSQKKKKTDELTVNYSECKCLIFRDLMANNYHSVSAFHSINLGSQLTEKY